MALFGLGLLLLLLLRWPLRPAAAGVPEASGLLPPPLVAPLFLPCEA